MDKVINGKILREEKLALFSEKIKSIPDKLKLVVIQVGENAASDVYVRNKRNVCERVGILFKHLKYDSITEDELVSVISGLNNDSSVTGILVQLPLPEGINTENVINSISPLKDVDGLTIKNVGALFSGKPRLVPCTALGVMSILDNIDANLEGSNVVVVGRSKLVGLPLVALLLRENATVTVCHSKTVNLKEKTSQADILIVAVGNKEFIKGDFVKKDSIVIDVGINRDSGKLYGDCAFDEVVGKCKYITPVPGGVGPLTITYLINNVIEAYHLQKKD